MRVVSVINYKGGVGKTTLTANLGAGLAQRGSNVLLIDLDPQASLTFSFLSPVEWREQLAPDLTIKKWYDSPSTGRAVTKLSSLVIRPNRVNQALAATVGRGDLDLIVSHQDLVSVDALLTNAIDTRLGEVPPGKFIKVYRRLANGLSDHSFSIYDYVLVDCAPDFHMMTKNALIASDFVLIPTRPDYLSTNGISHLAGEMSALVEDYNGYARRTPKTPLIEKPQAGVVFTMVDLRNGAPIEPQRVAISEVRAVGAPTFQTVVRDRKTAYPVSVRGGVPAVLTHREAADEIHQLIDEFVKWTDGTPL